MTNKDVLISLYETKKVTGGNSMNVRKDDLLDAGWSGSLPTALYRKFEEYWIRFEESTGFYRIVKVEPWMVSSKSESPKDLNAPLPITGKKVFNLKEVYMNQIKGLDKKSNNKPVV